VILFVERRASERVVVGFAGAHPHGAATSRTKILPSPILSVLAVVWMVSTTWSAMPSATTISSFTFGTKFTAYSAPR
jgi:hypothetical protein